MNKLLLYFQDNRDRFGNPEITPLKEAFDLTWNCEHKIALRWSWLDASGVRLNREDDSLLYCCLVWEHEYHLELKEETGPFLYVNHQLERYPGKIEGSYPYPNTISKCLTQEGEWLKEALEAGLDYLEGLG